MTFIRVDSSVNDYNVAHEQIGLYFKKEYSLTAGTVALPEQEVIISSDPTAYLNESSAIFQVIRTA